MNRTLIINLGNYKQVPIGKGKQFIIKGQPVVVFRDKENEMYCFEEEDIGKSSMVSNCIVTEEYLFDETEDLKFDLFSGDGINNRLHLMKLNVWIEHENILVQYTPLYIYDGKIIYS